MAKKSSAGLVDVSVPVVIKEPNIQYAKFLIKGTAPYVQNKFSGTKMRLMLEAQQQTRATSRKSKAPRDIEADYEGACHKTVDGKFGMPASGFRAAMISACRVAGFQMTKAKLSVFVEADDYDAEDGTPLVLMDGEPEMQMHPVRLESGVASVAVRPMWRTWSAQLTLKYDGDQFSHSDVTNLLKRAGEQVGVGEGRPDSKKSHGMGWGTFELALS